jgi:lysophosphatidate acyltransferase
MLYKAMMSIWPNINCTPLAKKELIYSGPFGIAIWLCGITFIDRLNHEKAKGTIELLADRIKRENVS